MKFVFGRLLVVSAASSNFDTLMEAIKQVEQEAVDKQAVMQKHFGSIGTESRASVLRKINAELGEGNGISYSTLSRAEPGKKIGSPQIRLPCDQLEWISANRNSEDKRKNLYAKFLERFQDSAITSTQFGNAINRRQTSDRSAPCSAEDREVVYAVVDEVMKAKKKRTEKELYEEVRKRLDPKTNRIPSLSGFSQQMLIRKAQQGIKRSYTKIPDDQRRYLKEVVRDVGMRKPEVLTQLRNRFKDETISEEVFDKWWSSGRYHTKPRTRDGRIVKPF
jgi:hypothetical protein